MTVGGVQSELLAALGPSDAALQRIPLAAPSSMRRAGEVGPLVGAESSVAGVHALGSVAQLDALLAEDALDGTFRDAEAFRDAGEADALGVTAHRAVEIVRIERQRFHGYVYNLETETGWYGADGIITHNCRTVVQPIPNYAALGLPTPTRDDPRTAMLTFDSLEEWLRQQPAAKQDVLLGRTRGQWYREGKLPLAELIDQDDRVLTLSELRERLIAGRI